MTAIDIPTREDLEKHKPAAISPHDEIFGGEVMDNLTPNQRSFVIQYLAGPDGIRGIAYQAYFAAGYKPSNMNSASAAVSQLLRSPSITTAIAEVRGRMEEQAKGRMKAWVTLAVHAQDRLEEAVKGQLYLRAGDVAAIKEVLERAIGKPVQKVENEVGNRLDRLLRDLAARPKDHSLPAMPAEPTPVFRTDGEVEVHEHAKLGNGNGNRQH